MEIKTTEVLAYALDFASRFEAHKGWKGHTVNTIFMGLLKAADTQFRDPDAKDEADKLGRTINDMGYDAVDLRDQIKGRLAKKIDEAEEKEKYDQLIRSLPNRSSALTSMDMLKAVLDNKTSEIRAIIGNKNLQGGGDEPRERRNDRPVPNYENEAGSRPRPENVDHDIEDLIRLTRQIRENLMRKIYGQNHAIQSVVDGLWNCEIVAMSDPDRVKPRGVFVFAGPSGVGKTFLAVEMAKELELPYMKFDMSAYSSHDSISDLCGFAKTYKDAKKGILTDFVANNPHSILIFDEVEKAHRSVIQLFLQMLDAGTLTEIYDGTAVSFKDVTVVFTTNAGRELYKYDDFTDASAVSKQSVIEAIREEINPETRAPYFSPAICSRFASGTVVMFNHLEAQHLELVCDHEFRKVADQIEDSFGISLEADDSTIASLLYGEGGQSDARALTAKTGMFIREEIKKLFDLFADGNATFTMQTLGKICFRTELENAPENVKKLYENHDKPELLFIGADDLDRRDLPVLGDYRIHRANSEEEALEIIKDTEISMALIQIDSEIMEVNPDPNEDDGNVTFSGLDYIPVAASALSKRREELINIHRKLPKLPIYILETGYFMIDRELEIALMQDGARGIVHYRPRHGKEFAREIRQICDAVYMQQNADSLKKLSKALTFETAPLIQSEKNQAIIRLRNFQLEQIVSVKDQQNVMIDSEKIETRFSDIIGAEGAKEELAFFVEYLKNPKKFLARNLRAPKGILLYGAPGTGKTMLAKAMAGEANVAFLSTEGSSFMNKYVGIGAAAVRELFARARRYAPSIIFIDEIDTIGRQRTGSENSRESDATLNALLTEMDGMKVDPKRPVFVLAATNYDVEDGKGIGRIDEALARRFDRKIRMDLPDKEGRKQFLTIKMEGLSVSRQMITQVADRSIGMSLANLESAIELAKRNALKAATVVDDKLFDEAFETIVHGEKKDWGKDVLERVARHEIGHTIISFNTGEDPAYVTIVARGSHGGYMQKQENNSPIRTRQELRDAIRIALGGRAAEIIYYGEDGITTGSSADLAKATSIARQMVCSYGMDDDLGLVVYSREEMNQPYLAEKIHQKVNSILKEELEKAMDELKASRSSMDLLVDKLLEKNQLSGEEISDILL